MFWNRNQSTWKRPSDNEIRRLQFQVDDLQRELEAEQRRSSVKDAEIEELAAVVVRNRERVKAETAIVIRQRAEQESSE